MSARTSNTSALERGRVARESGRLSDAATQFEQAIADEPDAVAKVRRLVHLHFEMLEGDPDLAEVVQATVAKTGAVKVDKVWVAADVGRQIINPAGAMNQVQGAALEGLSHALYQKITIVDGAAKQSNFADYPLLKMAAAPRTALPSTVSA